MVSRLIIAAAGSGKTQTLIEQALSVDNASVLITTYTDKNVDEICNRIVDIKGFIPSNISVIPWFTYLLRNFVRPYQSYFNKERVKGIMMVGGQSTNRISSQKKEFYFDSNNNIYSDKIAFFANKCIDKYDGLPLTILTKLYQYIFIDELQDMAGHDLEHIKKLILFNRIPIFCVADPRQCVFVVSQSQKNKNKSRSNLISFFLTKEFKNILLIDESSKNTNYRCTADICELSNSLYPQLPQVLCGNLLVKDHMGVFFVRKSDIPKYMETYRPMQLCKDKNAPTNKRYAQLTFGKSKGTTFDRVIIYPTKTMLDFFIRGKDLKQQTRAQLYVALTRARFSVAIIYDYPNNITHRIIKLYQP